MRDVFVFKRRRDTGVALVTGGQAWALPIWAFAATENNPSSRRKDEFCFKWIDRVQDPGRIETRKQRRRFLLNLVCFAGCIEGLFFFGAFAYVYYLRSRGLLHGLASGTNWVFRDESCHMAFAFEVIRTAREEEPDLVEDRKSTRLNSSH